MINSIVNIYCKNSVTDSLVWTNCLQRDISKRGLTAAKEAKIVDVSWSMLLWLRSSATSKSRPSKPYLCRNRLARIKSRRRGRMLLLPSRSWKSLSFMDKRVFRQGCCIFSVLIWLNASVVMVTETVLSIKGAIFNSCCHQCTANNVSTG